MEPFQAATYSAPTDAEPPKPPVRVLICGGRKLNSIKVCAWLLENADNALTEAFGQPVRIASIIEGCATGGDEGGEFFAIARQIHCISIPAQWDVYGANAGPIRNRQMLLRGLPDIVIAFPGTNGTANMIAQARQARIPVIKVAGEFR